MGLSGSISTEYGLTIHDAYANIAHLAIDRIRKQALVVVNVYVNRAARDALAAPVRQFNYPFGEEVPAVIDEYGHEVQPRIPAFDEIFSAEAIDTAAADGRNLIATIYITLKAIAPFWATWQDVFESD